MNFSPRWHILTCLNITGNPLVTRIRMDIIKKNGDNKIINNNENKMSNILFVIIMIEMLS